VAIAELEISKHEIDIDLEVAFAANWAAISQPPFAARVFVR
jgi:hypothetical protein